MSRLTMPFFRCYFVSDAIFGKMFLIWSICFDFFYNFCLKLFLLHSHCKMDSARYCHKSTYGFVYGARYYCPVVAHLEISMPVLKYPLHCTKIRPVGAQLFRANGRTYVTDFEKVLQVALWQHIFMNFDRTIMNCEQDKNVDTTPKLTVETFSAVALYTHLICVHSVM
jgi:hypothetical protein